MNDEDRLADLLIEWEELQEQGRDVAPEELCKDCPHLSKELARRIHGLKVTAWLNKPLPPATMTKARTLAGRYRLDRLLAEGGFAEVWKGFDLELQRTVAIKMPKRLGSVEAFMAEARKVARLKHHGIVPIFDVGKEENTCFLVSEFIEGGSLAERIAKPSVQESARIIAEVAETLHYAHQQGFIHRDLKPANILLDHHGRALLTDFGIAVTTEEIPGPSLGTLPYMAPEQIEGKPPDTRSDIYSLGVVLHELLTGQLPYSSADPNVLRREILSGPRNFFASSLVLSALKRICKKCLALNSADRYTTAGELAADLLRFLAQGQRGWKVIGAAILVVACLGFGFWWRNQPANQEVATNLNEPPPKPAELPPNLEELLAQGKKQFDKKDYKAALETYNQAVKKKPKSAEALHRRGASLCNLGKFQESLVDFDQAIVLDPKNADLRRHRGLALGQLRRYDQAIAEVETAIQLNPADQAACHKLLGLCYYFKATEHEKNHRWREAVTDMTLALKYDPAALFFHQRGSFYFNLKEFEKAIADFTEAIKREPEQPRHYQKRGLAYQALGKNEEAAADFEKARR